MCDQSEIEFKDGEVVWVKLGSCLWPGQVVAPEKLPPDVLPSFKKPPIAVVKFFQEDTYEFVKNTNSIFKYNCERKHEFIKKGLDTYRTKHGHNMEKFPEDVIRAETATDGDITILTRDEFQEIKKESYKGIFGTPAKKTPVLNKKGKGRGSTSISSSSTPNRQVLASKSDYKVHILVQSSKWTPSQTEVTSVPSTSQNCSETTVEEKCDNNEISSEPTTTSVCTPKISSGTYSCHACPFTTTRLNVMIIHNKTHSATFVPYTPSPVRKKVDKIVPKSIIRKIKTPKDIKPRKEKTEKQSKKPTKRASDSTPAVKETKKVKTDVEIKSSLLADWDDGDEDSNDESLLMIKSGSPDVPVGSESPAVPTPSAQNPDEPTSQTKELTDNMQPNEKVDEPSDSKYDFCEDEDWPEEADAGRKIPRVKNPSKRKEETKSINFDDNDVAREVADLLSKTTVPELPCVPETLKIEENFPEPPIIKTPDKKYDITDQTDTEKSAVEPQSKPTIFKTKTFFRSRHSRSQDAIGKYVAEQLNAAERMDMSDGDLNGSDIVSSPEARESPPVEHVKVAKLAPKIQLKKMKAEALQMQEKEKNLGFSCNTTQIDFAAIEDNKDTQIAKGKEDSHVNENKLVGINNFFNQGTVVATENEFSNIHNLIEEINVKAPQNTESRKNEANSVIHLAEPDENGSVDKIAPIAETAHCTRMALSVETTIVVDPVPAAESAPIAETVSIGETATAVESASTADTGPATEIYLAAETYPTDVTATAAETAIAFETVSAAVTAPAGETAPASEKAPAAETAPAAESTTAAKIALATEPTPILKFPDPTLQTSYAQAIESLMNESTASAVDALLSVSLEKDRVTKVVSDDPPEDLFEDDKDNESISNVNGFNETLCKEIISNNQSLNESLDTEPENADDTKRDEIIYNNKIQSSDKPIVTPPSESDLQIAEALINLPSAAIQNNVTSSDHFDCHVSQLEKGQADTSMIKTVVEVENNTKNVILIPENIKSDTENQYLNISVTKSPVNIDIVTQNDNIQMRFETEQEKSENLNAAQSLVQMSESINHNIFQSSSLKDEDIRMENKDIEHNNICNLEKTNNIGSVLKDVGPLTNTNTVTQTKEKLENSSKLLKILEEPVIVKPSVSKVSSTKQIVIPGTEKILNFGVGGITAQGKTSSPKQKIIIRRTGSSPTVINNLGALASSENIILSRENKIQDGSSVQTYTIKAAPEKSTEQGKIIIQPKIRKIIKQSPKLQKLKTNVSPRNVNETTEDAIFDINSMPIVLSDDILTPENIEKMPIVMSDGNILSNPIKTIKNKAKTTVDDKVALSISPKPDITKLVQKQELKTLKMTSESTKPTTPNILSKSSKLRGAKPMLVIDKMTGKQKIVMTKSDAAPKDVTQIQTKIQPVIQAGNKPGEKFIILPSSSSPRPSHRTQKIVIGPQPKKTHVVLTKGPDPQIQVSENKTVSAKLMPTVSEIPNPGNNTVMIITNSQGAQSRIVLTPEHEKILFPNKQQPHLTQIKTIASKVTASPVQKAALSPMSPGQASAKIVPKQKSAIITSKGQLIVGGRVAATTHNIAPMPEIRSVPKRIIATEPKKLVQTIQKSSTEPLIFLQQKSGSVMQLTAAQFEHLQRTGQIVPRTIPNVQENKIVVQKSVTLPTNESVKTIVQKQKNKRQAAESPTSVKKVKHEIAIAPAPGLPALTSITNSAATTFVPKVSNTVSVTTSSYPELDNFEELLPSTAIVRQAEPVVPTPEPVAAPPPAPLADGQIIAVQGENFGGPPGSFYLCLEDSGTIIPIDNRPLVLENNQLVPMAIDPSPILAPPPERRDILEAALANSDVFHAESPRDEAPDFRDLNANVSVHCRVSETSTTLNQPIMTPVEVPSKRNSEPAVPSTLEDGLAVIGVTPHTVPTSLELPITVTDPRIAPKTTDPLSGNNYGAALLPSPNTEMTFVTTEEANIPVRPISMPLLMDDEAVGKSMPLLTDEVMTERAVSSVESMGGSPSSLEVRESEVEESGSGGGGGGWARRLLTPGSDSSDTSAEIPLQPAIQLTINHLAPHS